MHGMLEIPEGFKVPVKNEGEMFTVPVEFTVMNGMLMPVAIDGIDLPAPQEEGDMEEGEGEGGGEGGGGGEDEDMGGEGGGGFMIAIEKAMGKGKR
jgi:hypothetical protein